jgi:hypothetical protein
MSQRTAVGVFASREQAQEALDALRRAGFPDQHLGLISPESPVLKEHHHGLEHDPTMSRWEEGAEVGAAAGAATGLGWGLAVAAGFLPAVGPVIAGGTLMALIASAGAGAAAGTLLGGLIGFGIPEDDAAYFDEEFRAGRTLVTVQTGSRYSEARAILHHHGATERPATTVGARD